MRMYFSSIVLTLYFVFGLGTVSGTTVEKPSAHDGSMTSLKFVS